MQVGGGRFREAYACTSGASRGAHGKLEMAKLKVLVRRRHSFLRLSIHGSANEVNRSGDDAQVVPCHRYLVVLNCSGDDAQVVPCHCYLVVLNRSGDDAQVVPCHRYLVIFHPSVVQ